MTPDQQFARLVKIAIFMFVMVFGYFMFADAVMPMTPQAMATRMVTKVTPQVSGKIASIAVENNQLVAKGDVLFSIDSAPYELAAEQATLALEQAKQDNAELDASILAAKADVQANQSSAQQRNSEAKRLDALYASRGVSQQLTDQAQSEAVTAQANLLAAKARLTKLVVSRGRNGEDNLKVRQAQNRLAQAELNLSYTQIRADQNGVVTNLQLEVGSFATVGQPLLAVVSENVDIIADFREKSLRGIEPQSTALVAFDGQPGRLYHAKVSTVDAGVSAGQFDANGRLADPQESVRWVRDAQRLRLHLELDHQGVNALPAGARATVQLVPNSGLLGFLAKVQIKVISTLHYIY
ncbi:MULTISPECIES: HlyD family secretion protein [unclassified Shewanella]|jgi:multidrug resistance efflux pump|uniref:HlyD family secretion protein n=1 Tax=unclassified Shewanella TaxID=196818 RepID=UPI00137BFCEB|nr:MULTISPECIES: HlyD family secretion protein [unclassified Shewanella]MBB1360708.1 HlyD family secretion protein [Shewanella sp. SR44-4]QHS14739.1 HlyD family secretion protein [Shewanella sp. Arc9-LZ]